MHYSGFLHKCDPHQSYKSYKAQRKLADAAQRWLNMKYMASETRKTGKWQTVPLLPLLFCDYRSHHHILLIYPLPQLVIWKIIWLWVCIHRGWLTSKVASRTLFHPAGVTNIFLPSCRLSVLVNMAQITRGKPKTMTTSDTVRMKRTESECDCFCLFVFCLAPPSHSCHPGYPGVAVYLRIFGFSGCCCLDMNHESFSRSLQEMLGASCYGYTTPWLLRETPCKIHLTSETHSFVCLSLFHWCCSGPSPLLLPITLWIKLVLSWGCFVRMESSSGRLNRLGFKAFPFFFFTIVPRTLYKKVTNHFKSQFKQSILVFLKT